MRALRCAGSEIVTGGDLTDFLQPQATLVFTDGTEVFNADTNAGAVDRLYEGLFGRAADGALG